MVTEGMQFSWWWNGGTVSMNLRVIWEKLIKGNIENMPRALLITALLTTILATGIPAFAQSAPADPAAAETTPARPATSSIERPAEESLPQRFERWNRVLNRIDEQLKEKDLSRNDLNELEATVELVRRQVITARRPLQREVDRIRALLSALGPLPKGGDTPETENVAAS